MITTYPTQREDIRLVAQHLRHADCQEIEAGSGKTPLQALGDSVDISSECYTLFETQTMLPFAILGIAPSTSPIATHIWCLGTEDISRLSVGFLKVSVAFVSKFQNQYPILTNVCDCRNTVHLRYLEWLKFKFIRILPTFGVERRPFVEFCRIRPNLTLQPAKGVKSCVTED